MNRVLLATQIFFSRNFCSFKNMVELFLMSRTKSEIDIAGCNPKKRAHGHLLHLQLLLFDFFFL